MELRRDGYDLHPLEGSVDRATGLHDRDQRPLRTHINQIPARLDDLDRAGHRRIVGLVRYWSSSHCGVSTVLIIVG